MPAISGSPSRRCRTTARRTRWRKLAVAGISFNTRSAWASRKPNRFGSWTLRRGRQGLVVEAQRDPLPLEAHRAAEDLLVLVERPLRRVLEPGLAAAAGRTRRAAGWRDRQAQLAQRGGDRDRPCTSPLLERRQPVGLLPHHHPAARCGGEADVARDLVEGAAQGGAGGGDVLQQRPLRDRDADVQPQGAAPELLERRLPERDELVDQEGVGAQLEGRLGDAGRGAERVHVEPTARIPASIERTVAGVVPGSPVSSSSVDIPGCLIAGATRVNGGLA